MGENFLDGELNKALVLQFSVVLFVRLENYNVVHVIAISFYLYKYLNYGLV